MTETDFSVADVLAWARTKPADERYDFTDSTQCAIAQFGAATNRPELCNLLSRQLQNAVGTDLFFAAVATGGNSSEWTFGAFVKRLESLCPETPVTKSDWLAIDTYLNADCGKVEA